MISQRAGGHGRARSFADESMGAKGLTTEICSQICSHPLGQCRKTGRETDGFEFNKSLGVWASG